jgi:EAL domain-containing protein (putative c-di-GMP-specific phosphodiesterase class I)
MITALDRKVVELILETYPSWQAGSLAINLSVTSLLENSFTDWLYSRLKTISDQSLELFFEFPESSVISNLEAVREFSRQIKKLGHDIGIDHFGRSFANFGYLKSLQPDYVKIDAAFTRELNSQHSDGYFFIGALTGVAHSLDIKVIAEGIETETQLDVFKELKVDGFQGYLVEQPLLLSSKV